MKAKFIIGLAAVLGIAAMAPGAVIADNTADAPALCEINTSVDLAFVSKYVWRGLVLNEDPAFQPSITFATPGGLSFNVWGSMDLTDIGEEYGYGDKTNNFTEIDYTLAYTGTVSDDITWSAGFAKYTFPHTFYSTTTESFGSICFGGKLSPTLAVNYDFEDINGYYAAFSLGYDVPVNFSLIDGVNLNARVGYASSSYNEAVFGIDKGAFNDVTVTASAPLKLGGKLKITPNVSYSSIIDSDLSDQVEDPDNFYGGVTFSYAF